jgi:hypothetical protein
MCCYQQRLYQLKNSMRNYKLEKLQNGESFITSEKGNSMTMCFVYINFFISNVYCTFVF